MALNTVAARVSGDIYQWMYFWYKVAPLLEERSNVEKVCFEYDEAGVVDDVVVFYGGPGKHDNGSLIKAEYAQIKYHVDNRDTYSSKALIDPKFLSKKSTESLLKRFLNAYEDLKSKEHTPFTLNLVSNWQWEQTDILAPLIRNTTLLPDAFISGTVTGALKKLRQEWQTHLGIKEEQKFINFLKCLRFEVNFLANLRFKELVHKTLQTVGLRVPNAEQQNDIYAGLTQQLLINKNCEFDANNFRQLCTIEKLFAPIQEAKIPILAVRSFYRAAESIELEADRFICVDSQFHGRHLKESSNWTGVAGQVKDYFAQPQIRHALRQQEHGLLLECHGSLALLTGYELSFNSGCTVYPIQKPQNVLWKPANKSPESNLWVKHEINASSNNEECAVVLSVTHDIAGDVVNYLGLEKLSIVNLIPTSGFGHGAVSDGTHAYKMAEELSRILKSLRPGPTTKIHLFVSAPNSLLFFLGQFREALGPLALYEFDFSNEKSSSYEPSFELNIPFTSSSTI